MRLYPITYSVKPCGNSGIPASGIVLCEDHDMQLCAKQAIEDEISSSELWNYSSLDIILVGWADVSLRELADGRLTWYRDMCYYTLDNGIDEVILDRALTVKR